MKHFFFRCRYPHACSPANQHTPPSGLRPTAKSLSIPQKNENVVQFKSPLVGDQTAAAHENLAVFLSYTFLASFPQDHLMLPKFAGLYPVFEKSIYLSLYKRNLNFQNSI